jgi:hypothetical protein
MNWLKQAINFYTVLALVFLFNTLIPRAIKITINAIKNILVEMLFITENILVV